MGQAQAVVGGDREGQAAVLARQLLHHHRVGQVPEPGPAVGFGRHNAHQPHLAELGNQLVGQMLLAVPLTCVRTDPFRRKPAYRVAEGGEVFR